MKNWFALGMLVFAGAMLNEGHYVIAALSIAVSMFDFKGAIFE